MTTTNPPPSKARIARDVRITTDANTTDLLAIRADGDAPEHIRKAALSELARRGFDIVPATFWCNTCDRWTQVHDEDEDGFWCDRCGEAYECGECGYEIDRHGECQRPEGCQS